MPSSTHSMVQFTLIIKCNIPFENAIKWEGGSGWGTHVNPWLFHFNV